MLIPEIIIVASEQNSHAQAVFNYLQEKHQNITVIIWDTSHFPMQTACKIVSDKNKFRLYLPNNSSSISLEKLRSIWWLEPKNPLISESIVEQHHADFAYAECCQLLEGLWYIVDCLWVNQPERQEVSCNPLFQLRVAQISGFDVPNTLVTNRPQALLDFWEQHQGQVMCRQLLPLASPQKLLQEEELEHTTSLELAPFMFQEIVELKSIYKALVIGEFILSTETFEQEKKVITQQCTLPREIESKVRALLKNCGLVYSALEIGIDQHGNCIFSALDPRSEFLQLEEEIGAHLTEVMAQLLVSGKTRKTPPFWPTLSSTPAPR